MGKKKETDNPLKIPMLPAEPVTVRPQRRRYADNLDAGLQQRVRRVRVSDLFQQPLDQKDVLQVLEPEHDLGVQHGDVH